MTTQPWIYVDGVPITKSPDSMARDIQRALGVTADGKLGPATLTAYANRKLALATNNPTTPAEISAKALADMARSDLRDRTISEAVFVDMVKYGLGNLGVDVSLGSAYPWGAVPPFNAALPGAVGTSTPRQQPTSTPRQQPTSTPRQQPTSTQSNPPNQGLSSSDASASLGTRLSAFYQRNRTAVNIAAGVLVVGTGVAIYMAMKDDSEAGEGSSVSRRDAERAARLLQISADSDKQSIRAAAARAMAAYQSPSDAGRRASLAEARETLLRWNAERMWSSGLIRGLPRGR